MHVLGTMSQPCWDHKPISKKKKKKKTIDNNETSTNVMTQTICMYITKVNQNETNVSPLVKQK